MKLVEINWKPTDRQLRQFGVLCLVVLPLLGWWWSHGNLRVIGVLAAIGLFLALLSMPFPRALRPIFLGLSLLAIPIGMVLGEVAMMLIYFGVFLPLGILFRLRKRDALQLAFDRKATTYWRRKKQPPNVSSYYRQF